MDIDSRTKLLFQEDFFKLNNKKIVVIGIGGVGSIIPISLVRTGIKNITIIDKDKVDQSNLNRQIAYNINDIGKLKVDALYSHLYEIQDDVKITKIPANIDENFDFGVLDKADYVIDCIDDINAKVLIAKETFKRSIPLISSLGMGNRVDPSKVEITKLNKTTNDPLAKKFRYLLRKENIDLSKIDVAFSSETPIIKDKIISSVVFVPNSAGLNIASFVIRRIIGW